MTDQRCIFDVENRLQLMWHPLRIKSKPGKLLRRTYGQGPFNLTEIKNVPDLEHKAARHTQYLIVRTCIGEVMFSGFWFVELR
jgi:hypothetical protein